MEREYQQYHGRKLNMADGREWDPRLMPRPVLRQWHWEQCMQAHARGFAVWPTVEGFRSTPNQESTTVPRKAGSAARKRTRTSKGKERLQGRVEHK